MISSSFSSRLVKGFSLGLFAAVGAWSASPALAQTSPTPVTYSGGTLSQNFDSLPATGTGTVLPEGFGFSKSNRATTYSANDGSAATGDVYSYGLNGFGDRALGTLASNAVVSIIGVFIRNNTGAPITQFTLSYNGEQYRVGGSGVADRLDFQYSSTATDLTTTKEFKDADALDFVSPVTTTGSGKAVTATTAISATVTGLNVPVGGTLVLRWVDTNMPGNDDGLAIDDFNFSTLAAGGPTPTPAPTATPVPTPATTSGAIISEFRLVGNGNANDEFFELANITNGALDLTGWTVSGGGVSVTIPSGKLIPPYGHLLLTGSAYSLGTSGGNFGATGDIQYTVNFPENKPLSLLDAAGTVVDSVDPTSLPSIDSKRQFAYVRRLDSGSPQDTDSDVSDFNIVDVGSTVGPGNNTGVSSGLVRLGAPGPKNLSSPRAYNTLFNVTVPATPTTRVGSGNSGTLAVRRTITNIAGSGRLVTAFRFRVVGLTAGDSGSAAADVRLVSSTSSDGVNLPLILQEPPAQSIGGGLNSTLSLASLPGGGLAPGQTMSVEMKFNVFKSGTYLLLLNAEPITTAYSAPSLPDDDNMLLGNPSGAVAVDSASATATDKENLLVRHNAEAIGYQKSAGGPRWVSWHLDQSDIGNSKRSDNFIVDPSLPTDCRITDNDYSGSGYTRGHQCPSGDRTASDALNQEAFYLSNMLPQTASLNNGVWAKFEDQCRSLLNNDANELYIISGGIGSLGTIAGGKVNVPARCWKVAIILPKGTNDISRITSSTRILSINVPNNASVTGSYTDYYTTVDAIEAATGLDLLSNLPDSVENALEAKPSS